MSIVDFPNMDYDKGMGILKYLGYPEEDAELLAHQFAGHFEDDFGAELKTAVKESFLVALKHPGHSNQDVHNPKKGGLGQSISNIRDKMTATSQITKHIGEMAKRGDAAGLRRYGIQSVRKAYPNRLEEFTKAFDGADMAGKVSVTTVAALDAMSIKNYTLKHPGHANQDVHGKKSGSSSKPRGQSAFGKIKGKWDSLSPERKSQIMKTVAGVIIGGAGLIAGGVGAAAAGTPNARYARGLSSGYNKWGGSKRGTLSDFLRTTEGKSHVNKLVTNIYAGGNPNRFGHKEAKSTSFTVKEKSGRHRWVAVASGPFEDRDRQWVTHKALSDWADNFGKQTAEIPGLGVIPVRYNANNEPEPVVRRWWHCGEPDPKLRTKGAGIDFGYADYSTMVGRHLVISGLYFDEEVGAAFAEKDYEDGNSIGFFHPATEPNDGGEFNSIDIFDVTALPGGNASYPFTAVFHA